MRENPCRYCALSYNHNGKHSPSYENQCAKCTNRQEHNKYLQSQRKFESGEVITLLDELLEQEWVMWHGYTKHIEVFKSMPLRVVLRQLEAGAFHKAIRKEAIDERK